MLLLMLKSENLLMGVLAIEDKSYLRLLMPKFWPSQTYSIVFEAIADVNTDNGLDEVSKEITFIIEKNLKNCIFFSLFTRFDSQQSQI